MTTDQLTTKTTELRRLQRSFDRLQDRHGILRTELKDLEHLRERGAYVALRLTEAEYLSLVAIMVDVVAEDPDIPTLSIHRKLQNADTKSSAPEPELPT